MELKIKDCPICEEEFKSYLGRQFLMCPSCGFYLAVPNIKELIPNDKGLFMLSPNWRAKNIDA